MPFIVIECEHIGEELVINGHQPLAQGETMNKLATELIRLLSVEMLQYLKSDGIGREQRRRALDTATFRKIPVPKPPE